MNDIATRFKELIDQIQASPGPSPLCPLSFLTALALFASIGAMVFFAARSERRAKEEIRRTLEAAFDSDEKHVDLTYIRILAKAWGRQKLERVVVAELLEDLILHIASTSTTPSLEKIERVKSLLAQERAEEPYDALPDEERRLLRAISDSLVAQNSDATRSILKELESVLGVRHRSYAKLLMQNKWSIPLAIIGILLSIAFGIPAFLGK